ncbi:ABC-2 type transport system permease protein [Chitinophaga terrae (ex Kim and Jung 2007)]|uniref:Gldg family protein n=1 Tax=Chitinophaga terrae (ex Kim and Jung 2007) TaxID=408074 RepID=UPI002789FF12|nr:Gldg family protein [Chitinophaga terrae (ex Kim and Jung 2007)]MDQ0109818.1 ABC-2 type transport system permease protein [Chitinophaga terrae (ex Kim and Jung 2007)]
MIFKIAKTDLRNLFYSPVAWFLTIAFWIQIAYFYMNSLLPRAKWYDISVNNDPKFKGTGSSFTAELFLMGESIFANILQNLYLFVPLLTMDLISREMNSGTIKLLYSSPIKTRDIVLGKYLAIMFYNLLLLGIIGIFLLTGYLNIQSADYGILLSSALGFYLLVCAYTAIGLFMSSLSNYPIVSAIGSFIVVLVLGRIGTLWQQYDFVRDLTYFLSISGRTGKMLTGLITTKDILYFLAVIYIFVGFTLIRLKGARSYQPWPLRLGQYILVFATAVLIGFAGSRPGFIAYWDTTAGKIHTLRENTQKIIKDLGDEPVQVTLYTNLFAEGCALGFPEKRNDYLTRLWEPYLRFKPNLSFRYVYYYDVKKHDSMLYRRFPGKNLQEIAKEVAKGFDQPLSAFQTPEEVHKEIDLEPENYAVVMELSYKGRKTFLRTFIDNTFWPNETQVAAALKRLQLAKMPKVIFLTGNLERSVYKLGEREYSGHSTDKQSRGSLINNGFDIDTICLENQDIPKDANIVVLADPKTALSETSQNKLKAYTDNGGNLLITGEPGKQSILNPVLESMGIRMLDGTIVQLSRNYTPDMLTPYITREATGLAEQSFLVGLRTEWDTARLLMPGAAPLVQFDSSIFHMQPLLMADTNAWLKTGRLVIDSAAPVFNPAEGDVKSDGFVTALQLKRNINNKEQRIIVCGDADFMDNNWLRANLGIEQTFYSWMDNNDFPIYPHYAPPKDDKLRITYQGAIVEKTIYLWLIPGLLLMTGTVLLIRRKRQ